MWDVSQWLESLVLPGRWLDYTALQCIADDFVIFVFVVSVLDRELDVYHLGYVERQDGRLIMLVLMNGHWGYIARREGYYWPSCWFAVKKTRIGLDNLLGGILRSRPALVDASTAALQFGGGRR